MNWTIKIDDIKVIEIYFDCKILKSLKIFHCLIQQPQTRFSSKIVYTLNRFLIDQDFVAN